MGQEFNAGYKEQAAVRMNNDSFPLTVLSSGMLDTGVDNNHELGSGGDHGK